MVWSSQSDTGGMKSIGLVVIILFYFFFFSPGPGIGDFWIYCFMTGFSFSRSTEFPKKSKERTERIQFQVDLRLDPSIRYTIYIQ